MKKFIAILILAIYSPTYMIASTLQEDLVEIMEVTMYARTYYNSRYEMYEESKKLEDLEKLDYRKYPISARKTAAIAYEYMTEHYKEFDFDVLEAMLTQYGGALTIHRAMGYYDAKSHDMENFTAMLKACERVTELSNKYPEIFTDPKVLKIKEEL